ncbi:hypothetical protein NP233_g8170 [Leucocoprinus birnbaumii]|uniref:Uncharacterized protein n=1 Tax=Leucocoprinus birnbaumii TaxID=56174 RepID=A0AAD5VMT8_9AGAR|nr:hypothetical protein NP233_g8170 [Leucocoprinus birnbaumii]
MRFSTVAAALLTLTASVAAQGTTIGPFGQPVQCRRFNKVNWKAFNAEKKVVALVAKDTQGNVVGQQTVDPLAGTAQMMMPEFFSRFVKFFLIDVKTNVVFAKGEQVEVDCPPNNMQNSGFNGGLNGGNNAAL